MGGRRGEGWEGRPPGRVPDHRLRKDGGTDQQGPQKLHVKGLQVTNNCLQQLRAGALRQEQKAWVCKSGRPGKEGP